MNSNPKNMKNWEKAFVICSIQLFLALLPSKVKAKTVIRIIPTIPSEKNKAEGILSAKPIVSENVTLLRDKIPAKIFRYVYAEKNLREKSSVIWLRQKRKPKIISGHTAQD